MLELPQLFMRTWFFFFRKLEIVENLNFRIFKGLCELYILFLRWFIYNKFIKILSNVKLDLEIFEVLK